MSLVQTQIIGEASAFGRSLRTDLADARGLSIAVAFAKESALREVDVETWSRNGHTFNLVAGTDFALTELDLLKRFSDVPSADCRIYHSLSNSRIFHPKLYILDKGSSQVVYVGSSNFTRGGLRENIEANVRLEGPGDAPEIRQATGIFTSLFDGEYSSKITEEDELRYTELQRRLRAVQTYPTFANYAKQMQVAESLLLGAYRATASNTQWLLITTPENFAICARSRVWGMQKETEIRNYLRKDVFFFHVTGGRGVPARGVAAFGMFIGEPYYDETPLWQPDPRGRGVFPWRIRIHLFDILDGGIPTKEILAPLYPDAKAHWINGFVAKTHRLIPRDFEALRAVFEAEARAEHAMEPEA